jgi:MscS family membrane protein
MSLPPFFSYEFLGNTYGQYLIALLVIVIGVVLRKAFSTILSRVLFFFTKRYTAGVSQQELHDVLIQPLSTMIMVLTFYAASTVLTYPHGPDAPAGVIPWHQKILVKTLALAFIIAAGRVALRLVDFALLVVLRRNALHHVDSSKSRLDSQFLPYAKDLLKVFIIIIVALIVLGEVFDVNVTALVGGLGIGGLAVAFAAKESLENLIASFTIFLDQPFGVGDLVQAGDVNGTVEKIGFRSTRLRTAEKSYLTVPNKSMIDKPLDNLSQRTARRVGFTLLFDQRTTSDQLHAIIAEAVALMQQHPQVTQEVQMKFNALTVSGKEVTVQYFVDTTNYDKYLDVKEDINYRIVEVVERYGGYFASIAPSAPVPASS